MNTAPRAPHVLLVDDAPEIRELLREVLEEEGYRVTSAGSVQHVDAIRELAPDLIVHDLLFAESRPAGWTFLQALRQDPQVGQLPVILCTADGRIHTDPAWAQQVQRLELRVVTKPFDLTDFLVLVETALPQKGGTLNA
jgi:two-component system nitrogen regulation response regulator NtrX